MRNVRRLLTLGHGNGGMDGIFPGSVCAHSPVVFFSPPTIDDIGIKDVGPFRNLYKKAA